MRPWVAIRRQLASPAFSRSIVVSALATGSDFAVANGLSLAHAVPALATFLGCAVGGVVAFSVNRAWTFGVGGRKLPQIARFLFVWASSALFNSAGVSLLLRWAPVLSFASVWIVVRGLVYTAWNFPMLRVFVFPPGAAPARISDAGPRP